MVYNKSECIKCRKITYKFETYNIFELDILGVYNKMKNNNITLKECLQYIKIPKIQNLFCQNCKEIIQTIYTSAIYCLADIVIFSLNRGDLEKDNLISIPFIIEKEIDLTCFVEIKNSSMIYELTGVVSIIKEDNNFIFVYFCKSPIDKEWYFCKDKQVEEIDLKNILSLNNENGNYIPCILGYKIKN